MEIKRKIEIFTATNRRLVVRRNNPAHDITCTDCGTTMVTSENAAKIFGISQRNVFRLVEAGSVHFTEVENGELMICLRSLTAVLDKKSEKYL